MFFICSYVNHLGVVQAWRYDRGMAYPPQGPRRRSDYDEAEERRYWDQLADDEERAEHERIAALRRAALETMDEWFFKNFENPESETPRDPDTHEFVFPWGGPFDATQALRDRFDHEYDEAWIAAAAEEIERNGTYEWAPTSYGEYYEHPDPGEGKEPAILSQQILGRLDQLEAQLAELQVTPDNIGHNRPPEEIGLPPYEDGDQRELRSAIAETRSELAVPEPDAKKLAMLSARFGKIGKAIGKWLAGKADLIVDEAIKRSVQALCWTAACATLVQLSDELARLAEQLMSKF